MASPALIEKLSANARAAEHAGEWMAAAGFYTALRQAVPGQVSAWLGEARALRESGRMQEWEALMAAAASQFPTHLPLMLEHARAAESKRDWAEAYRRWRLVFEHHPDRVEGKLGMALALREQLAFDAADAELEQAIAEFGATRQLLESHALVAHVRRDWPTAIVRWSLFGETFPDHGGAHQGLVAALREANRLDEAEAALARALARQPGTLGMLAEKARIAAARGHWEQASAAWEEAHAHAPDVPEPIVAMADILMRQNRHDEAAALINRQMHRFPDRVELAACLARIANRKRDWPGAADQWAKLEARFPQSTEVLTGYAEALWALKREDALVEVLDRLLVLQPHNVVGAILYARYDMRHSRAKNAVSRLMAAQERSPNNPHIAATLNDARMLALVESPGGEPAILPATLPGGGGGQPASEPGEVNLFAQFQSLGSGCEFGLLQRRFGVEPLDLLRWASISPRGLIRLLERRFEGIGKIDSTSIKPEGGSYVMNDHLFDMGMQTFIATATESAETLLPKLCKRQIYLANKMKESLADADRLLVYKATAPMAEAEIQRLNRALRQYGNNTLLVVQLADPDHPSGSLEIGQDGVLLGYIDRFSNTDISVEAWTEVCRQASEHWAALRQHQLMLAVCNAWD